jgi:O-methyltransferase involved in polyketide biosynthesis
LAQVIEAGERMSDAHQDSLRHSVDRPSPARVYDYVLGGSHNYAIDREFAEAQLALVPDLRISMQANRAFLGRAVRYAVESGIRQFVDIGSGLPTEGNVHEVADEAAPGECRVIYLDNEPIARAHADILLADTADNDRHRALLADYFDYIQLWQQVLATGILDPTEPTCLLLVSLLHFMPPQRQPEVPLAYYRSKLAPGSLLVISHGTPRIDNHENARAVVDNYERTTNPLHLRTADEVTGFFGDWPLVEPGMVFAPAWRPDPTTPFANEPHRALMLVGVAKRP